MSARAETIREASRLAGLGYLVFLYLDRPNAGRFGGLGSIRISAATTVGLTVPPASLPTALAWLSRTLKKASGRTAGGAA